MTNYFKKYLKYKKKYLKYKKNNLLGGMEEESEGSDNEGLDNEGSDNEGSDNEELKACQLDNSDIISILTFNIGPQTYYKSLDDYKKLHPTHVNEKRGYFFRPQPDDPESDGRPWPEEHQDLERLHADLPSPEDFLKQVLFENRAVPHVCCFQEWQTQDTDRQRINNLAFSFQDTCRVVYESDMERRMRVCPKCINLSNGIHILLVNVHGIIPFNNTQTKNQKVITLWNHMKNLHDRCGKKHIILCGDFNINLEEIFKNASSLQENDPGLYEHLKDSIDYMKENFQIFRGDEYTESNISRLIPPDVLEQMTPDQRTSLFRSRSKFDFILISNETLQYLDRDTSSLETFPQTLCTLDNYEDQKEGHIYFDCDHMPLCAYLHFPGLNPRLVDTPDYEVLTNPCTKRITEYKPTEQLEIKEAPKKEAPTPSEFVLPKPSIFSDLEKMVEPTIAKGLQPDPEAMMSEENRDFEIVQNLQEHLGRQSVPQHCVYLPQHYQTVPAQQEWDQQYPQHQQHIHHQQYPQHQQHTHHQQYPQLQHQQYPQHQQHTHHQQYPQQYSHNHTMPFFHQAPLGSHTTMLLSGEDFLDSSINITLMGEKGTHVISISENSSIKELILNASNAIGQHVTLWRNADVQYLHGSLTDNEIYSGIIIQYNLR
jgi:hypothetical protein